jgi:hypothetical protein
MERLGGNLLNDETAPLLRLQDRQNLRTNPWDSILHNALPHYVSPIVGNSLMWTCVLRGMPTGDPLQDADLASTAERPPPGNPPRRVPGLSRLARPLARSIIRGTVGTHARE